MSHSNDTYSGAPVIELDENSRASFIAKTYAHLTAAIFAFVGLEILLFQTGLPELMLSFLQGMPFGWLLFLGVFMVIGWLATRVALSSPSQPLQYLALAGYVVAEALLFLPILWIADRFAPGVISSAALVTFVGFAALTAIVFFTRKDFSFLRGILLWGGIIALVAIVTAVLFGANLGTWFSVLMIAFAGAAILYDTSNVLHHYPEDRYVGAALQLFASIALMFWYVLRLFMSSRN